MCNVTTTIVLYSLQCCLYEFRGPSFVVFLDDLWIGFFFYQWRNVRLGLVPFNQLYFIEIDIFPSAFAVSNINGKYMVKCERFYHEKLIARDTQIAAKFFARGHTQLGHLRLRTIGAWCVVGLAG